MTVRFVSGERTDTLAHICSRRSLFGSSGWRTGEAPPVPSQWRRKGEDKEMEVVVVSGLMSPCNESAIGGNQLHQPHERVGKIPKIPHSGQNRSNASS